MNHKKIMLIDDDDDDQFLLKEAIKEIACDTECFGISNGSDALTYLRQASPVPSLIFLDLNMPMMNGLECLRLIKMEDHLKHIPVIIYSTSNNPKDQRETKEMGADMFFTKVSDYSLLKEKLLQILGQDF